MGVPAAWGHPGTACLWITCTCFPTARNSQTCPFKMMRGSSWTPKIRSLSPSAETTSVHLSYLAVFHGRAPRDRFDGRVPKLADAGQVEQHQMAVDSHSGELAAGVVGMTGVGDRYAPKDVPYKKSLLWVLREFEEGLDSWARYPCGLDASRSGHQTVLTEKV